MKITLDHRGFVEENDGSSSTTVHVNGAFITKNPTITQTSWINAKNEGAVGDGAVNDLTNLQNAFLKASYVGQYVRGGSAMLYLPAGTYRITSPWVIAGVVFTRIVGDGPELTKIVLDMPGQSPDAILDLKAFSFGTIENISIYAVGTTTPKNVVYLRGTVEGGICTTNKFINVTVGGPWIEAGFRIGGTDDSQGIQVDQTSMINCSAVGQRWNREPTRVGDPATGLWRYGYIFGDGKFSNNLVHWATHCRQAACAYGVVVAAANLIWTGGLVQTNDVDFHLVPNSGVTKISGIRSEGSCRLLDTIAGGGQTTAFNFSIDNCSFSLSGDIKTILLTGFASGSSSGSLIINENKFQTFPTNKYAGKIFHMIEGPTAGQSSIILSNSGSQFILSSSLTGVSSSGIFTVRPYPTSATSTTLTDTSQSWSATDNIGSRLILRCGTGAGQSRTIVSSSKNTVTIDTPWSVIPDRTTGYVITIAPADGAFMRNKLAGVFTYSNIQIFGDNWYSSTGVKQNISIAPQVRRAHATITSLIVEGNLPLTDVVKPNIYGSATVTGYAAALEGTLVSNLMVTTASL